jgi:hypothetical protein
MRLHTYEGTLGWRWTVESEEAPEGKVNLQMEVSEAEPPIGSSAASFKTEADALANAKDLALGILDAFASTAIEDHLKTDEGAGDTS